MGNTTGEVILILANPISGRGRGFQAAEHLAELLRRQGAEVRLAFTQAAGHARSLSTDLAPEIGRLAVVGGDGTVNEVISGLRNLDVPMAVLPMGTANLLGTALGLRDDPEQIAAALLEGRTRRLDLGAVGGRRFISVAGVGYDAAVSRELGRRRQGPITKLSYLRPTVRTLLDHRPVPLSVSVDGRLLAENAAWVLVCNVKNYAAYFQFTPDADPADGLFDLCILNNPSRRSLVNLFLQALRRRRSRSSQVAYARGRQIKIWSRSGRAFYELDGDFVGETPIEIELLPAAIPILVPSAVGVD